MRVHFIIVIGLILTACGEKTGYVRNSYIYNNFEGKKELERKVIQLQDRHNYILDSILLVTEGLKINVQNDLERQQIYQHQLEYYQKVVAEFRKNEQEKQELFNERIWKHINLYIEEYGKLNEYTYIHGADGSGSLMYADSTHDISEEVLKFVNEKYSGF